MTVPESSGTGGGGAVGDVPDEVYLCQVDEKISCGACCGLYNVADASREGLTARLAGRTARFHAAPRTVDGLLAFAAETGRIENGTRPYPEFHHCPYVGLIGDRRSRVGCLLHPLGEGNEGVDYRGLSYYGGMACRDYFCPACKSLPAPWKRLVRAAAGDWYRFGLVVTEVVLLTAFFSAVEKRAGRSIILPGDAASVSADLVGAVSAFIDLRIDWPFRPPDVPIPNYFFEDRRYGRPPVWYHGSDSGLSRYAEILRELGTAFADPEDRARAEALLDRPIDRAVAAVAKDPQPRPLRPPINGKRKEPVP